VVRSAIMAKPANPWVKALQDKKAAVDLHPDVLRAVLRMNPGMRGGDRSTEEVASTLLADLPRKAPGQALPFADGKFKNVFDDMLTSFEGELQTELKKLDDKRQAIDLEQKKTLHAFLERIVSFLVEVQPGPLSDLGREVIREHLDFLHALKTDVTELSRRVREESERYTKK
jgi:hypothetical protein